MRYHVPSRALPWAGCSILLWKFVGLCWHGWFDIFQCVGGRVAPGGILDYKNNINNGLSHCVYYKQSTVVVLFLPPGIEKPLSSQQGERTHCPMDIQKWWYLSDGTWVLSAALSHPSHRYQTIIISTSVSTYLFGGGRQSFVYTWVCKSMNMSMRVRVWKLIQNEARLVGLCGSLGD